MASRKSHDLELILEPRHLFGVCFVLIVLLTVSFAVGNMVGRSRQNAVVTVAPQPTTPAAAPTEVPQPAAAPSAPPRTGQPYVQVAIDNQHNAEVAVQILRRNNYPARIMEITEIPGQFRVLVGPVARADLMRVSEELHAKGLSAGAGPWPHQPGPRNSQPEPRQPVKLASFSAAPTASSPATPPQGNSVQPGQSYLQLLATSKQHADAMVDALRGKSFPALDVEVDVEVAGKPALFRVLVGPVAPGELAKLKTDLQLQGFPANAAIPKTFAK